MTISVWRYSHLALAVSSFILLTLASVTGIILAFEPVMQKVQPYHTENFDQITLAQTLPALRAKYPDISELTIDHNHFVQIKGSYANGKKLLAYADPLTGKILGAPKPQSDFFQAVTTLHRSLFLHGTGRLFMGITAFLLMLITVSGTMLVIQRQRGVKRFFKKIAKDNFAQYWHVVFGRWSLIPIFIIALTGTFLSLERFGYLGDNKPVSPKINFDAIRSAPKKNALDFAVFKNTYLSQVESVEFPFSDDVEDYYIIKLKDREIDVNQVTGEILGEVKYPTTTTLTNFSLNSHTGRASAVWAIILAIASANILFFIYSGFAITIKRRSGGIKNKFKANESKFIILVGSENGNTMRFAKAVQQQLLKAGERPFVAELNSYRTFPKAEHIMVLTATYGLGDAPTNASRFASLLAKYPQAQPVYFSVLGFGSHAYPDFCKFAFGVHQLLSQQEWAKPLTDIHTVNDRSPEDFKLWAEAWSQSSGLELDVMKELHTDEPKRLVQLSVTGKIAATAPDGAFSISLRPKRGQRVTSGDLLAIYPANDHRERLYSIGVINEEIRLSVRLHPNGLGSGFLHRLLPGDKLNAQIVDNPHFHFPKKATDVIMVSNGTGIAPFLGMISQNKASIPCYLYCGFRNSSAYQLHEQLLEESKAAGKVKHISTAFSRDGDKQYVSHLIERDGRLIAEMMGKGAVLMICGSLAMEKDVMISMEAICEAKVGKPVSYYQSRGQILTDCY